MDVLVAPDPVEVASFHFSQLRTLRIAKGNEKVPQNCVNIVTAASKYGLLFVGLENGFKVLKLENILDLDEDRENKSIEENYYCQLVSCEAPVLLCLSADQKTLAVCVNRGAAVVADMYDIAVFADPEEMPFPFQNINLSDSNRRLKEFIWNPAVADMYAFCLSDGSLNVHELSGTQLKTVGSAPAAGATAVCWSPKGKQIVVGKADGSFSQYKPTLQEVKNITPPKFGERVTVENICWVSTAQFVVLYVPVGKGVTPYLFVVSTPKGAAITYTNFYDVCLGNSISDDQRYFLHFEPAWGILICASTDSIEIAVIGDSPNWVQWDVKEDGKALLPTKDGATHAVGVGVMYCSQRKIVISEYESYPPMPIIFFLTDNGLLVPFHMVNSTAGLESLVRPSTPIGRDGERKGLGVPQQPALKPVVSKDIIPTPIPPTNTTVMQPPPLFHAPQPPQQESKSSDMFATSSPSPFGLNQNVNQPRSDARMQVGGGMCPVQVHSVPMAPAPAIPHVPSPVPKVLSFTPPEQEKYHKPSHQPSFNVPAPVTREVPKPTTPQRSDTGNMVNKEDLEKQNTYMAAIMEEIQTFERELTDLKGSSGYFASIGTKEEMSNLRSNTLSFQEFQKEVTDTMTSLNSDIHDLKNALLESFVMVEEANSRERRKNDHLYLSLLRDRALGPIAAKRMKKIEQNYLYINSQIQEVSNKIDQDWFEYLERKKENQKSISHVSSVEAIYKTLVNNQNIIHNLRKNVDYVSEKAAEKRMENISRRKTQFIKRSGPEDLSKLADTFLHAKITPDEDKSPTSKKISSNAQTILKNYFASAKVNTVRPTVVYSPSQSRLISKSMLYKETPQKSHMQPSPKKAEISNHTAPLATADQLKTTNNFAIVNNAQMESQKSIVKTATASKLTLPVMKSPSPEIPSSPSASSSGAVGEPFYEDITPPGSPGALNYHPEALAILQHFLSQGNCDEEKLKILVEAALQYSNNPDQYVEAVSHTNSAAEDFQHEPDSSYQSPKHHFEPDFLSSGNVSVQPTVTSHFGLNNVTNQVSAVKTTTSFSLPEPALANQNNFFKGEEFLKNQPSAAALEKPNLFSFSQTSTVLKDSEKEGNSVSSANQFTSYSSPFSSSALATSNQPFNSTGASLEAPPNQSVPASTAFFPTQSKTLSFFTPSEFGKKSEAPGAFSFTRNTETSQTPVAQVGALAFSTAPTIASLNSSAPLTVPPSLVFSTKTSSSPILQQSTNLQNEKVQDTVVNSGNVPSETTATPSSLPHTASSLPSEASVTTSSFLFGKAVNSSKTSTITSPPSLIFSPNKPTKDETAQVTSAEAPLFSQIPLPETKSTSSVAPITTSLFETVPSSQTNPTKGTTSFLFGQPTVAQPETSIKPSLPEANKTIATPSAISQAVSLTSYVSEDSSNSTIVVELNSGSPKVTVLKDNSTLTSSTPTIPSGISITSIPSFDPKTTTTASTNPSDTASVTAGSFGLQIAPTQSPVESIPSTTVAPVFGQSSTTLFTSPPPPPSTQSSFFGASDGAPSTFFGKAAPETATTTQSSFFAKTSLETAPTTQSFFTKTTEAPAFGQGSFAQGAFGSALNNPSGTSAPAPGSFFSQPVGGAPSVFGASATNTSENTGFGTQSGGSFSFGKSPFGQTQSSFGLAKSVFGQNNTFGQPTSPQANTGFGQSSGGGAFGQGFSFSGLGGQPSEESAAKNVFSMGNIGKQNTDSNIFGNSGASTFGAKTGSFTGGSFSSGGGSVVQSGFGAFQQSPQSAGGFGAAPAFGGTPSFGSPAAFGSPPSFGSGNALGSVFGASQQSANFSNFASANSPTFGTLASQSPPFGSPQQQVGFGQQPAFGNAPAFGGGSAFGSQAPSFGSPSTGGGQGSSSAFTQWRN